MQTSNEICGNDDLTFEQIMENPIAFAEINDDALGLLWDESIIAASEVDSPNNPGWDEIQQNKFDALVDKFWCRFILQYSKMARENKIGEKCDATQE